MTYKQWIKAGKENKLIPFLKGENSVYVKNYMEFKLLQEKIESLGTFFMTLSRTDWTSTFSKYHTMFNNKPVLIISSESDHFSIGWTLEESVDNFKVEPWDISMLGIEPKLGIFKNQTSLVSWLQSDRGVVIRTYEDYKKLKAKVESLGDTFNCMPDDTEEAFESHLDKHGVDLRDGTRGLIVTTIPEFGYYWSWTLESYEEEYGQCAPYELSEIGVK